jgi:hypothetical protein
MNRKFEQFLVWYLPILIISRLSKGMMLPYMISRLATHEDQTITYLSLTYLVVIAGALEHVVAAGWIWKTAPSHKNRILWALFALFSGLWGVLFYLAVMIYDRMAHSENQPKPLGSNRI